MKVKICGIRTREAAQVVVAAGADFLGFNFVPTSKRYIEPEKAKEIIDRLPRHSREGGNPKLVGVFQNEAIKTVNNITHDLGLDFVQLHGEESFTFIKEMIVQVIKVFPLPADFDEQEVVRRMNEREATYYMIDREKQGEGLRPDPIVLYYLARKFPLFIAGGLTPENVTEVIKIARPFAVDVAGGIETDGKQDLEKITLFIKNAKGDAETSSA